MNDPFALLGLPRRFALAPEEVDRAYLARSAAVHPDAATGDPEADARMADLNHARAVLLDPERRAAVLLSLLGGPQAGGDRSLPDGFLMEIMEVRQEIEEAVRARDPTQRSRWERWAEDRRAQAISEVGAMFDRLGSPPTPAALAQVRQRLNAWRYIERLIEQLDPEYHPPRPEAGR